MNFTKTVSEPLSAIRYAVCIAGVAVSFLGYSGGVVSNTALSALCLVTSVGMLVHVRRNRALLLIVFVFTYTCYSVFYANYLHPITSSLYMTYRETTEAGIALSSLLLYLSALFALLPANISRFGFGSQFPIHRKTNAAIVAAIMAALLLILIFGFTSSSELGGERGSQTSLYEYSTILFPLMFLFSGDSKSLRNATILLLALFCVRGLASGERVTALQLLFIVFFMLASSKVRNSTLILVALVGLSAFTVMGSLRAGITQASIADLFDALANSLDTGMAWDTAYSAWHTSITFVLYGKLLTISERLSLFAQWLLSIPLGNSVPNSQLPSVTHRFFQHAWGGVLPVYFQFYLGPAGVILIAIYTSLLLRMVNHCLCEGAQVGSLRVLVSLYVVITSFRWILYSPSQITRGAILCLFFSALLIWIDSSMRSKGNRFLGYHDSHLLE